MIGQIVQRLITGEHRDFELMAALVRGGRRLLTQTQRHDTKIERAGRESSPGLRAELGVAPGDDCRLVGLLIAQNDLGVRVLALEIAGGLQCDRLPVAIAARHRWRFRTERRYSISSSRTSPSAHAIYLASHS